MSALETWMPFYVADYLKDTRHLSTEEHGAYVLLLMTAWTKAGALPADDERLRRITGMDQRAWKASRATLLEFFRRDGDTFRHKRIDEELAKASGIITKRSEAGKQGAARRWGKANASANGKPMASAMANAWQNDAPSQSPSPEEEKEGSISSSSVPSFRDDDSDPVSIAHSLCRTAGVSIASPKAIATSAQLVRDWQQAGATPDLMRSTIVASLPKANEPISSLRYFDKPIRHAIALEANAHGQTLAGHRQPGSGGTQPGGELGRMAAAVASVRAERMARTG